MATHRTPEGGAVPPSDPGPASDEPGSTQTDTHAGSDVVDDSEAPAARPAASSAAVSAAERAGPASSRAADLSVATTTKTTGEAVRAYLQNLRNGELGSLPALLGL